MSSTIRVYGSHTCEDTALVRDRLLALNVPFTEHDKEDSPRIQELLEEHGRGSLRTPTIVIGDDHDALVEPSLEELEESLTGAGHVLVPPKAVQFEKPLANRPAPNFSLATSKGGRLELGQLRGRKRSVLFFAHDHACRVCQGYAKQLAARQAQYAEYDARLLNVLQDDEERAAQWAEEFAHGSDVLADGEGSVKQLYAAYFADALRTRPDGAFVLILDLFTAPRAGSFAGDAGGLVSPKEIASWLQLLDFECDE